MPNPARNRKDHKKYIWIALWCKGTGSMPYYAESQQKKAFKEGAPLLATFKTGNEWRTLDGIESEIMQERMRSLATNAGESIPQEVQDAWAKHLGDAPEKAFRYAVDLALRAGMDVNKLQSLVDDVYDNAEYLDKPERVGGAKKKIKVTTENVGDGKSWQDHADNANAKMEEAIRTGIPQVVAKQSEDAPVASVERHPESAAPKMKASRARMLSDIDAADDDD